MLTRVPPVARHVDAAAKGEAIVDDDDLLVMGSAGRMGSIEARCGCGRATSICIRVKIVVPRNSVSDGADIPAQQVDFQFGPALDQPEDEVAQLLRAFRLALAAKMDAGVEIPADEHDPAFCRQHRQAAGPEIVVGIDDQGGPARLGNAPAVRLDAHGIKALRGCNVATVHEFPERGEPGMAIRTPSAATARCFDLARRRRSPPAAPGGTIARPLASAAFNSAAYSELSARLASRAASSTLPFFRNSSVALLYALVPL